MFQFDMDKRMVATIIGSRKIPKRYFDILKVSATILESHGWLIRTGDAVGSDQAAREGVLNQNNIEVYTPNDNNELSFAIGERYHPAWNKLSPFAKNLIARNSFQILGTNLDDPSDVVIMWTPDGTEKETSAITGGSGQCVRLANALDIPVINLFKFGDTKRSIDYFYDRIKELIQ